MAAAVTMILVVRRTASWNSDGNDDNEDNNAPVVIDGTMAMQRQRQWTV